MIRIKHYFELLARLQEEEEFVTWMVDFKMWKTEIAVIFAAQVTFFDLHIIPLVIEFPFLMGDSLSCGFDKADPSLSLSHEWGIGTHPGLVYQSTPSCAVIGSRLGMWTNWANQYALQHLQQEIFSFHWKSQLQLGLEVVFILKAKLRMKQTQRDKELKNEKGKIKMTRLLTSIIHEGIIHPLSFLIT